MLVNFTYLKIEYFLSIWVIINDDFIIRLPMDFKYSFYFVNIRKKQFKINDIIV